MPTKRQILEELKREELIAAADRFDVPIADRRVKTVLVEALASSHGAATEEILADLKRDRLKELCRALDLDDGGREKAILISRLIEDTRGSTEAAGGPGTAVSDKDRRPVPEPPADRPAWRPSVTTPPTSAPRGPRAPATTRRWSDRAPSVERRDRPADRPRRKQIDIQDGFLFESLKENRPLVFALSTGQFIEGRIKRFDRFAVLVETGGKVLLIYKSAISDISWPGPTSQTPRY